MGSWSKRSNLLEGGVVLFHLHVIVGSHSDLTATISYKIEHRFCLFRVVVLVSGVFLAHNYIFRHGHLDLHFAHEFSCSTIESVVQLEVAILVELENVLFNQLLEDEILFSDDVEDLQTCLQFVRGTDGLDEVSQLSLSFLGVVGVLHVLKDVLPQLLG